jgi:hypothetical protein
VLKDKAARGKAVRREGRRGVAMFNCFAYPTNTGRRWVSLSLAVIAMVVLGWLAFCPG